MKSKYLLISLMGLLVVQTVASASNHQKTINVSADVSAQLRVDVGIFKQAADGTPTGSNLFPNLAFGQLVNDGINAQRSDSAYTMFWGTNTSGRPYIVTWQMGNLQTAGGDVLENAMVLAPIRATRNNVDIVGDTVDTVVRSARAPSARTIYTSNASGTSAVIEVVTGISGGNADGSGPFTGWEPIPPDKKAGTYASTATVTIVLA